MLAVAAVRGLAHARWVADAARWAHPARTLDLVGCLAGLVAVAGVAAVAAAPAVARSRRRRDRATGAFRFRRAGVVGARWRPGAAGADWARRSDLAPLAVRQAEPGRLTLGRSGRLLLAAEPRQSVLVVGPTQTMKTSGFAVPALLEWEGPVLATSVKTDLLRDTVAWRRDAGRVWVYDPTACAGVPGHGWSPLAAATSWPGARRVAAAMVAAARAGGAGLSDGDFWYATAGKLLAPLLFAAAVSGRTMADVVRWVDTQEVDEVSDLLGMAGVEEAHLAAEASWRREDRQRSSVFTTAETILDPFADPLIGAASAACEIDPGLLLDGGANTLYLCAPSHEQRRLRPLFTALVDHVVAAVYERAAAGGAPVDPALLVVLDEAAAIAPLDDLDGLAATGAGQGIQLVTVWQDLAQVAARYGARAASVVNNHRAKVLLSGVSDPGTLEQLSGLVGDGGTRVASVTTDGSGTRSTTESATFRRLAPADALRRIPPGHGVLLYGHLPAAPLRLRPWFAEPRLGRRVRAPS